MYMSHDMVLCRRGGGGSGSTSGVRDTSTMVLAA